MSPEYLIRDMPTHNRPRERLVEKGAENLNDQELIAILLRTGLKGRSVVDVSEDLLLKFGSPGNLTRVSLEDLRQIKGVGRDKAVTLKAAFELARRAARDARGEAPLLDTPERVADYLRDDNPEQRTDRLQVLLLNVRRRLIRRDRLAQGTQDTLLVNPREVFRSAILADASAIVLAHNHPSGDPTPSEADIKVTRDLIRAGQLLKIEVLDHVIMGQKTQERTQDYISLRELGYFYA